jgi:hypothetical protein
MDFTIYQNIKLIVGNRGFFIFPDLTAINSFGFIKSEKIGILNPKIRIFNRYLKNLALV